MDSKQFKKCKKIFLKDKSNRLIEKDFFYFSIKTIFIPTIINSVEYI